MKKILFSDMDGTIIQMNEMRHIHDREMLNELKKQGHMVVFNNGRNFQEALYCIEKHQFPYDYLSLNNGAHIVNHEGKEIFKKVIPQDIGRKIIEYAMALEDVYVFFFDGHRTIGYCNGKTYEHSDSGFVEVFDICFVEEYKKANDYDIIAVHQVDEQVDKIILVKQYIEDHYSHWAMGTMNTHYLDINAPGCSKGHSITTLKELLGEDVETYSVGDSYNDISMFEIAQHSYTFHHVDEEISKHADKQVHYVYEVVEDMLREE